VSVTRAIPSVLQVENNYDVIINNGPWTRVLCPHLPVNPGGLDGPVHGYPK